MKTGRLSRQPRDVVLREVGRWLLYLRGGRGGLWTGAVGAVGTIGLFGRNGRRMCKASCNPALL